MNPYLALLLTLAPILAFWFLSRLRIWRSCRCGASYCNDCGRKK